MCHFPEKVLYGPFLAKIRTYVFVVSGCHIMRLDLRIKFKVKNNMLVIYFFPAGQLATLVLCFQLLVCWPKNVSAAWKFV